MFLMKYQPVTEIPGTNTTTFECIKYDKDLEKLPCSSQTVFFDNQVCIFLTLTRYQNLIPVYTTVNSEIIIIAKNATEL